MTPAGRERRVLCPVDFSDLSRRALRYAVRLAERTTARTTALYVNDPLLSTAAVAAGYDERRLKEQVGRELRRFVRAAVPDASNIEYAYAVGNPAREINAFARRVSATVVVMGAHGLRGPRKLVLGSTTEDMLRTAAVPVLAISAAAPGRPPRPWPAGPVIAGIDLGPQTPVDVRVAAAVARLFESDLLLVHVLAALHAPRWLRLRHRESDAERVTRARTRVARLAAGVQEDTSVSFRVMQGDVADTLARIARRVRGGTLLLVLRQQPGVFGLARGAITYQVLTSARTPVLAVPSSLKPDRLSI